MAYTFADQLAKLSVLLGDSNTSSDDAFPLAIRKTEINRGELHFARDARVLQEYATTTVSGNAISLPSDWFETFVLKVGDQVISNNFEIAVSEVERYADDASNPYYYLWKSADTWQIFFTSDEYDGETVYLWYFKKPSEDLADDADVSQIDEEYREASVYYAAGQLLKQIGKVTLSQQYMNEYAAYVSQAVQDIEQHYIKNDYPRPDLGFGNVNPTTNRQGHGLTF